MAENEEFSMSDKQAYDMIQEVHEKVNLLTQEVRKNNHIKDEVEKIHIKIDEHNDKISCNAQNISNMQSQSEGQDKYRDKIMAGITILSLITAILSTVGVI